MASGSFTGSTSNQYITPKIVWSSIPSTEHNNSVVTATMYIYKNSTTQTYGTGTWYININGSSRSETGTKTFKSSAGWVYVVSHSVEVAHGEDGEKQISISGSGGISGTTYSSTNISQIVTLDNIPRASTLSLSQTEIEFGAVITATITPAVPTYSHKIKYMLGAQSSEYTLAAGATTHSFTLPTSWISEIPNAESAVITVTLTTLTGTTELGQTVETFTGRVPASIKPALASLEATGIDMTWGLYIQGISKASVAFNATGIYGSSISTYVLTGIATSTNTPVVTPILSEAKTYTLTGYVMDSRGRSSENATVNITVYESKNPTLTAMADRCTSSGLFDGDGTYIRALAAFACSTVGGHNSVTCNVKYRKVGASLWTDGGTLTSGVQKVIGSGSVTISDDYEVLFSATDALGKAASYTAKVGRAFRLINASGPLKSVAIGRIASLQNKFQVAMDAKLEKTLEVTGDATFTGQLTGTEAEFSGALSVDSAEVTNALAAGSLSLTNPLSITSGGTGATTAAAAREALEVISKPIEVWVNGSLTSAFAAQKITLALGSSKGVIVQFKRSDQTDVRMFAFALMDHTGLGLIGALNATYSSICHRGFSVSTTGVTFLDGYGGTSVDNAACIPIKIFKF